MRNEIPFTDEQIEEHFDENEELGGCIEMVGYTRDTLADMIEGRQTWADRGRMEEATLGGFPALIFVDVQAAKGQRRKTIVIIDYGTVRAVMGAQ